MKKTKLKPSKFYNIAAKRTSLLMIVKQKKDEKNEASFLFGSNRRKTNVLAPQLSKICLCYYKVQLRFFSFFCISFEGLIFFWATSLGYRRLEWLICSTLLSGGQLLGCITQKLPCKIFAARKISSLETGKIT